MEVRRDNEQGSGIREEREVLSLGGGCDLREGTARETLVDALEVVDGVDGGVDGEEDLDVSGAGVVGWNDCPGGGGFDEACVAYSSVVSRRTAGGTRTWIRERHWTRPSPSLDLQQRQRPRQSDQTTLHDLRIDDAELARLTPE